MPLGAGANLWTAALPGEIYVEDAGALAAPNRPDTPEQFPVLALQIHFARPRARGDSHRVIWGDNGRGEPSQTGSGHHGAIIAGMQRNPISVARPRRVENRISTADRTVRFTQRLRKTRSVPFDSANPHGRFFTLFKQQEQADTVRGNCGFLDNAVVPAR